MNELQATVDAVFSELRKHNILIVEGFLDEEAALPKINISTADVKAAGRSFVDAALSLRPGLIIADLGRLESSELEEAVEILGAADEADEEDRGRVAATLADCRERVGQLCSFKLAFLVSSPPSIVSLGLDAAWFDAVYETESVLYGQEVESGEEEDEEPSEEEKDQRAKELAENTRFQAANKQQTRLAVARKILGATAQTWSEYVFKDVVDAALAIFETEILPRRDDGLREKAKQLIADGRTRSGVASQLGMTTNRLNKLLGS